MQPTDIETVSYLSLAGRGLKELHKPWTRKDGTCRRRRFQWLVHQQRVASLLSSNAKPIDRKLADL